MFSRSRPFDVVSEPPSIPGARSDSAGAPARPLLVWVRTGTAHVHIDGVEAFHLAAGEGVWIPERGWEHRVVMTEPGTVAFPLWPNRGVGPSSEPIRFEVPEGWQDWLIQCFNFQVTPLTSRGHSLDALAGLLQRSGARPPASAPGGGPHAALLAPPPVPTARGARAVAEELLRDPAYDLTVEQWAARVLSSPRTLRRDFLAGTGLTFEQWRLHRRLSAAVESLAAGYDIDQVAVRAGFRSRSGFARAFRQRFDSTPRQFRRLLADHPVAGDPPARATAARRIDEFVRMVQEGTSSDAVSDLLSEAGTLPHASEDHVLSWVYRGSGYLDIGDRRYERPRGCAIWIPAAVTHVTGLRGSSISLPLGNAHASDLRLTEPMRVQFSPVWDDYLMFCAISNRSILQPEGHDPRRVVDLFAEQVVAQRALAAPMPRDAGARAIALECLRRIGSSDEPAASDLPMEIHRAFREQTGMTFVRWRYAARMRIARDLLAGGAKPSAVSRRVGYAHLPTFSAAFSRFHGLSPREYQRRESGQA